MTITSQELPSILAKHKLWVDGDHKGERADLAGANLAGADLAGADLYRADLYRADLAGADLSGANLAGANLARANLYVANLTGAKDCALAIAMTRILPEGSIIGWKKCRDDVIVKLQIPSEAKRSHAFGRKCRAEYAIVLDIVGPKGGQRKEAVSQRDNKFVYRIGETVRPDRFSEEWQEECAPGIHFFITREEAEAY